MLTVMSSDSWLSEYELSGFLAAVCLRLVTSHFPLSTFLNKNSTVLGPQKREGLLSFGLTLTPLSTTGVQIVRIKAFWFVQLVQHCSNIHYL